MVYYASTLRNAAKVFAPFATKYGIMTAQGRQRATQNNLSYRNGDTLTMTKTRPRKRKGRPSFKNQVVQTKAAKHFTGEQGLSMTHNTLYTLNLTAGVTQGDANTNRDGDAIYLCALKLKGFFNTDTAASGYAFRIIVGYSGEEYSPVTFGSGLGISEVFLPNTGTNTSDVGQINPKAFTVIYDEKYTLNSQISGVRDRLDYSINVPLNNKFFSYQSAASALGKTTNLYAIVMGGVIGGTTGTTAIGGTTVSWDFIFKNAS